MRTDTTPASPSDPEAAPAPQPTPESDFTAEGAPPPGRVGSEPPDHPADQAGAGGAGTPDAEQAVEPAAAPEATRGTATAPVKRRARIVGTVELRQGDGTVYAAPRGPCTVQITALDATLSWVDGNTHGLAALPLTDFNRHLLDHSIEFTDDPAP